MGLVSKVRSSNTEPDQEARINDGYMVMFWVPRIILRGDGDPRRWWRFIEFLCAGYPVLERKRKGGEEAPRPPAVLRYTFAEFQVVHHRTKQRNSSRSKNVVHGAHREPPETWSVSPLVRRPP